MVWKLPQVCDFNFPICMFPKFRNLLILELFLSWMLLPQPILHFKINLKYFLSLLIYYEDYWWNMSTSPTYEPSTLMIHDFLFHSPITIEHLLPQDLNCLKLILNFYIGPWNHPDLIWLLCLFSASKLRSSSNYIVLG